MRFLTETLNYLKDLNERLECKNLTSEFYSELQNRKEVNMQVTLTAIANYLVKETEKETGLLYSPYDEYIQTETQRLFWEWKKEGIINQLEELSDETKAWIFN